MTSTKLIITNFREKLREFRSSSFKISNPDNVGVESSSKPISYSYKISLFKLKQTKPSWVWLRLFCNLKMGNEISRFRPQKTTFTKGLRKMAQFWTGKYTKKVVFLEYERPIYDIFEKTNKTKLRFIHFLF